jgi:hypothetical protein
MVPLPTVIDNTMLSTFRSCPVKYRYEFVEKLRPSHVSVDLHAGGVLARGLEVLYTEIYLNGKSQDHALAISAAAIDDAWGDFVSTKPTNKTKDNIINALMSYVRQYDPPRDYISPSPLVERPFEYSFAIPLGEMLSPHDIPAEAEQMIYAGRFDMIGEQGGIPRIRDDKTASALGPTYERQFSLRSQFMGYCAAMQHLGIEVDTVEVRGIAFLKTEINHVQVVKSYPKVLLDRWKWQTARTIKQLVDCYLSTEWDYNFGDSCSSYGGCAFLDCCRSDEPERWFSGFTKRDWNPLERNT